MGAIRFALAPRFSLSMRGAFASASGRQRFQRLRSAAASARALKWPRIGDDYEVLENGQVAKTVPGGGRAATTAKSDALRMDTSRRAKPRWRPLPRAGAETTSGCGTCCSAPNICSSLPLPMGRGKEQRVFSACCANLLSELRALTEGLESSNAPKVAGLHGAGKEAPACRGWGACLAGASVRRADQTRSSLCMWEQRL